eukprot:symbB.v1.2.002918.t1/scaffold160.1/size429097/9
MNLAGSGGRPIIQPFEGYGPEAKTKGKRGGLTADKEFLQKVGLGIAGIWLAGWLLMGWDLMWPLYIVLDLLSYFLSFPPFSWFSWIFGGWSSRGAPLLNNGQHVEEATLPQSQVSQYSDSYVQQYGDAALIFSTHDGYPQIVRELLQNEELGYRDLLDARDDSGNTALIYAAAKGFRQCTAALLRAGADPELRNEGNGGRTPLMEAAGGGYKDIVQALRMMPNVSVDLTDDHGNTALHYAAYHGHLPVVMELLKGNPNKEIKNIYGHTAASYAASNKFKGVADVLNRADPARSQRRAKEKEKADEDAAKAIQEKIKEHLDQLKAKEEKGSKHVKGKADLHDKDGEDQPISTRLQSWRTWAASFEKSTTAGAFTSVETEAAIVDLKDQIGSLRKDLSNVRENVDQQLRRSEEQEQQLARALRHRVNSLCSELADCGIEALKLCADLGHRPYGEAILRSRSAPGDRPCWRPPSRTASCASVLTPASAPVPRRVTGPAVMGGATPIPTPFTPLMAPLSQLGRLGLSPRRVTAPAIPTASSAPSAPAPAPAAAAQATPALAFTEPVTALSGRGIQRAVNVLTAGAPLTTGSRINPAWRPAQPVGAQPLSPKETLLPPPMPGRWPSPTGRYLHRPFDQDSETFQAGDSSLKSSAENLLKLEDL